MIPIRDTIPSRNAPIVTWALICANVLVFVFQLALPESQLERLFYLFGIVPLRFTHPDWATWVGFPADNFWPFLTSIFLHGGWLHLVLNMWTLWIFGDNVEDRMGPVRFLLFYLFCGLVAGVAHTLTNANSTIPVIGASGAISGVLGAYFLLFPVSRILCVIPVFFYPLVVQIPAFLYILFWFGSQLFSGALSLLEPGQVGGIAWWAHIGGFVAGVLTFRLFVVRQPPRRPWFRDERGIEGAWWR